MTHLATLPARVLSRPEFGTGSVISLSETAASVVAAAGSRAVRGPWSGRFVPCPDDLSRGVHCLDDPKGGVARLITPMTPRYSRGCRQVSLPPEPRLWGKPPVRSDTAPGMSQGRVVTTHVTPP